jgi:hypothetical protein
MAVKRACLAQHLCEQKAQRLQSLYGYNTKFSKVNHVTYDVAVEALNMFMEKIEKDNVNFVSISPEIDEITGNAFINVGLLDDSKKISPLFEFQSPTTGKLYQIMIKTEREGPVIACANSY